MVNIVPKIPGFGERLGSDVGQGFGGGFQQGMSKAQEFSEKTKLQETKQKQQQKRELDSTFETILEEMKSLKDNVGPIKIAALNPYSEVSGKRSQINTLRLSLEGLFRDLTLKGQFPKAIYERILKELPQASDTPEKYLKKIEAVEKILDAHSGEKETSGKSVKKEAFNANNPEHKAKAEQLFKSYGDKERVREALKREFEGL